MGGRGEAQDFQCAVDWQGESDAGGLDAAVAAMDVDEKGRKMRTRLQKRVSKGKLARLMTNSIILSDGFGNWWENWCKRCEERSLQVIRPGKVQCCLCGR